ncbi:MAG: class I SAM-dependent methyltransferase [Euryarchaeota archaeon]|nr:class I SAM-dependent methyltransferase [Euryarchaeota archaeon]
MSAFRFNKPCELEDFSHPDLLGVLERTQAHYMRPYQPGWPAGFEYRKPWEIGMAILAAEKLLSRGERGFALGVGAGREPTIFNLTHLFRWVFATDLYLAPGAWAADAAPQMLQSPETVYPYIKSNNRRLVTQHMDGRELRYEDETFNFVFSSSSIEHFGDWKDVERAASEMGRVLKPGGVLTLSTEYRIKGPPGGIGLPGFLVFDLAELKKLIIDPSGCRPVDDLQETISPRTLERPVRFQEAIDDGERMARGEQVGYSRYPHIVLEHEGYSWTSYHLALRKPSR